MSRLPASAFGALAAALFIACTGREKPESTELDIPSVEVTTDAQSTLLDSVANELSIGDPVIRQLGECCYLIADKSAEDVYHYRPDSNTVRRVIRRGSGPGELTGRLAVSVNGNVALITSIGPGASGVIVPDENASAVASIGAVAGLSTTPITVVGILTNDLLLVDEGRGFSVFNPDTPNGTLISDSGRAGVISVATPPAGEFWFNRRLRSTTITHEWPGGPPIPAVSKNLLAASEFVVPAGESIWLFHTGTARATRMSLIGDTLFSDSAAINRVPMNASSTVLEQISRERIVISEEQPDGSRSIKLLRYRLTSP